MGRPNISIVLTTHNYERFLPQCLDSLLKQRNSPGHELIVVDDGSTDNTQSLLKRHARNQAMTIIRLDGVGLATASNAGIRAATGEWILRIDADDQLAPDALAWLWSAARARRTDFVFADLVSADDEANAVGVFSQRPALLNNDAERSPTGSGCLFRKSAWSAVGGYDETLRYQEDYDFWLKVKERFRTTHIAKPAYIYRQHPGSMSTNVEAKAAVRRVVKRRAVARRGLRADRVEVVIVALSPFVSRIPEEVLLQEFNGNSLLSRLNHAIIADGRIERRTLIARSKSILHWGRLHGYRTVSEVGAGMLVSDLIEFTECWAQEDSDIVVAVLPFYPCLDFERIGELIDSLLLAQAGRIDSGLPALMGGIVRSSAGWKMNTTRRAGVSRPASVQFAGGLAARNTRVDVKRQAWLEVLPQEGMLFSQAVQMGLVTLELPPTRNHRT